MRLPLNPQRNDAATLQRIASLGHHRARLGAGYTCSLQAMSCVSRAMPDLDAASGNSGNPLQPEPPRKAAARPTRQGQEGGRGKQLFASPGGFAPRGSMTLRRAKAALCCMSILHCRKRKSTRTTNSNFIASFFSRFSGCSVLYSACRKTNRGHNVRKEGGQPQCPLNPR